MKPVGWPTAGTRLALAASAWLSVTSSSMAAAPKPIGFAEPKRTGAVSFRREILPRLQASCLPCHNQTRAKASLNLETPELMRKGGDSGAALVPGRPEESLLLRTAAHQVEDLVMPPADNKANAPDLQPAELGLLSLWIREGGRADDGVDDTPAWKPIDPAWRSSFAVAVAPDDRTVALARANRVDLHDLATGRRLGDLADPVLGGVAQRDLVGALAFSPDGSTLAAAGFREVRLWRRDPPAVTPRPVVMTNGTPDVAAFSPDRTRIAWVTRSGHLEIRAASAVGPAYLHRDLVASNGAANVRLAWSPDGRWLAAGVGGTSGVVRLFPPDSAAPGPAFPSPHGVAALAWWDAGRRLAVAPEGAHPLLDLPAPATGATVWSAGPPPGGGPAAFTHLAGEAGPGGILLAAKADGSLRLWSATNVAAATDIPGRGPILDLQPLGKGPRFLAAFASGGVSVLDPSAREPWGVGKPIVLDPTARTRRTQAVNGLGLARAESDRAGLLKSAGATARKSAEEQLAKVRTRRDGDAKSLTDLERQRTDQQAVADAATKERDEAAVQLEKALQAERAADTLRTNALAAVAKATERHVAVAADLAMAGQARAALRRVAETPPPGDPAATNAPSNPIPGAVAASGIRVEELERLAAAASTERSRVVAELDAAAFAAGQRRSEADRARADLPPRRKQAEERLAAARKTLEELAGRIAKAKIALDGSTQDVALGERSLAKANDAIVEAGRAEETSKARIAGAEAELTAAERAAGAAVARIATAFAATPAADAVLLLGADGQAVRWFPGDDGPEAPFRVGGTTPLAVAAVDRERFLVLTQEGMFRVEPGRPWRLWKTLGSVTNGTERRFADRVNALAFSPDGRLLATGGGEPSRSGELKLWDADGGRLVRDLGAVHSDTVTAIAFSPRGDRLLTGGADRFARITPVEGDGPRLALEGHTHHVLAVAWDPDAGTAASAGADGVVKLWNAATGERRKNVEGFGKEVTGLLTAGANRQFVAVGGDGRGRLFRSDGEKVRDLAAVPEYLQALAVTRDGLHAVGADDRGVLSVWNLSNGEVRRDADAKGGPAGF